VDARKKSGQFTGYGGTKSPAFAVPERDCATMLKLELPASIVNESTAPVPGSRQSSMAPWFDSKHWAEMPAIERDGADETVAPPVMSAVLAGEVHQGKVNACAAWGSDGAYARHSSSASSQMRTLEPRWMTVPPVPC